MRRTARVMVAALIGAGALVVLAGPAQAAKYRPDGHIMVDGQPPFVGNDIYNNDGTNQTAFADDDPGGKVVYRIRAQNDGNKPDKLGINSNLPSLHFDYKFKRGATNITAEVEGPGYHTPKLLTGEKHTITLVVKISLAALLVQVDYANVEIDSLRDGEAVTDTVVAYTDVTG